MLLAVETCALVFNITRAMIGRNVTYHSLEKKKEALRFDLFGGKTTFSSVFSL